MRLTAIDSGRTCVDVTYTRTALDPAKNETVETLGAKDRTSGPGWQHAIEAALGVAASSR